MRETEEMQAFEKIGFTVAVGPDDEIDAGSGMDVQPVKIAKVVESQAVNVHAGRVEFPWHCGGESEDQFDNFMPYGHSRFSRSVRCVNPFGSRR